MQKRWLCVLDFEANCSNNNARDHEVAEFPVVLVDSSTGEQISEFRHFVRPTKLKAISPFIHQLTGITTEDVSNGLSWTQTLQKFEEWCEEFEIDASTATIVTCGDWDLKTMFPRQLQISGMNDISKRLKGLFDCWTNMKETFCNAKDYRRALGMDAMLSDLNLKLVGRHHSGIDDCRNIAQICQNLIVTFKKDLTVPNRFREVPYHFGGPRIYERTADGRIVQSTTDEVHFFN
jgi:ERI1 exoribonuclease 3